MLLPPDAPSANMILQIVESDRDADELDRLTRDPRFKPRTWRSGPSIALNPKR